jgi:hypothetical protein
MARSTRSSGDDPDQNIKNALQKEINMKLAEAELSEEGGNTSDAANLRRIAAEWQKVVNGTT